jgi:hypothetical protein
MGAAGVEGREKGVQVKVGRTINISENTLSDGVSFFVPHINSPTESMASRAATVWYAIGACEALSVGSLRCTVEPEWLPRRALPVDDGLPVADSLLAPSGLNTDPTSLTARPRPRPRPRVPLPRPLPVVEAARLGSLANGVGLAVRVEPPPLLPRPDDVLSGFCWTVHDRVRGGMMRSVNYGACVCMRDRTREWAKKGVGPDETHLSRRAPASPRD